MIYQYRLRKTIWLALLLALIPVALHVLFEVMPTAMHLTNGDINTTAITEWLGFSQSLRYPYAFYLAVPFFCALSFSQITFNDVQSGFINVAVFHSSVKRYWIKNMALSFLIGFVTVLIPLTLDLLATYTVLPVLVPDLLINRLIVLPRLTYFPTLYYQNPLLLTMIYIVIGAVMGGVWSTLSTLASTFFKRKSIVVMFPLLVSFATAIGAIFLPKIFFDANTVAISFSPNYLPPFSYLVSVVIASLCIIYLVGIWRVKKIVN